MSEPESLNVRDTRTLPFFYVHHAFINRYKPSWRAFIAYSSLAYFARGAGSVVAPIKTLATTFGVSEDTIKRGLAECAKKKVIGVKKRWKKIAGKSTKVQLPSEYILFNLKDSGDDPL